MTDWPLTLPIGQHDDPGAGRCGTTNLNMGNIKPTFLAWDVPSMASCGLYTPPPRKNPWNARPRPTIHEKISTAYAKLNIDTELVKIPVRGNVGVQAVHTEQLSNGFVRRRARRAERAVIPDRRLDLHRLPAEPEPEFRTGAGPDARFGLAKSMARPPHG